MFGFSLIKLLFTVFAVVAIWYGFKWFSRVQGSGGGAPRARVRTGSRPKKGAARQDAPAAGADDVEDMVACKICGDFVTVRGARSCGRDNCPYPG